MKRLWLIVLIPFLLVACGGDDKKEDEKQEAEEVRNSEMTLQAIPAVGTLVPGCDTAELENWYEINSANGQLFQDDARTYADLGPENASTGIDRLMSLQEAMMEVPVPECMSDLNTLLQSIMTATLSDFQMYAAGQIQQGDIQVMTAAGRDRYELEVRPVLEQTEAQLIERQGQ